MTPTTGTTSTNSWRVAWTRLAVVLAAGCLTAHLVLVEAGGPLTLSVPMLALSAVCVGCGLRGWGRASKTDALGLAVGGVVMVLLHLMLMLGAARASTDMPMGTEMSVKMAGHHSHDSTTPLLAGGIDGVMHLAVTVAGLQALAAAVALFGRRSPSPTGVRGGRSSESVGSA